MTPAAILTQCTLLERRLSDLGFISPEVSAFVNFLSGHDFTVRVAARTNRSYSSGISEHFHGEDFFKMFQEARSWIDDQKTPEQIRREQFMAQLGAVIDEGRDIGFDVEFMNPLVESMKKLSENVLEHH